MVRLDSKVADDGVIGVAVTVGHENVCLASERARCLIFPVDEVNVLSGVGKGVQAIKLDKNDRVLGFCVSAAARKGLEVETSRGSTTIVRTTKYEVTRRAGKGRQVLKRGRFVRVVPGPVMPMSWDAEEDEEEEDEELEE